MDPRDPRHPQHGVEFKDRPVRCPLCFDLMRYVSSGPPRNLAILACDPCRIAIRVDDPFVGQWYFYSVPCPNVQCSEERARVFMTSVGFMKAVCQKCGAALSNTHPDRTPEERERPFKLTKDPETKPTPDDLTGLV